MLVYGKSQLAFMPLSRNRSNRGRSIGTYNWDPVVEIEYPEAFQEALLKVLDVKKTFRYIYLGGAFIEPDQEKSLWFFAKGRHVRVCPYNTSILCGITVLYADFSQGLAQTNFLEFGKQNQNVQTYVVRPAAVLAKDGSALLRCLLWMASVKTDELAAVMVDLAVNGGSEQVVGHKVTVERGRELTKQR